MTARTILIALDVDTDVPEDDLLEGMRARLSEFYPTDDGMPMVPENVHLSVSAPDALDMLLAAATVGLEGYEDALPAAWAALTDLRS